MTSANELMENLRRVKEIDKIVDLSKSTIQLEILLLLGMKERITVSEVVARLNYRRKAITDTLRKLCKKKLVIRKNEELFLTKEGKRYIEYLLTALGFKEVPPTTFPSRNFEKLRQIINNISMAYYIHEILLYLALSPRKMASLETLAQVVNLSPQRLRTYLDLYVNNPNQELRLFKVIHRNTLLTTFLRSLRGKRSKFKVYYKLTKQGLSVAYKLPTYVKIKRNAPLRLILYLTKSLDFKDAARKMFLIICIGTILAYVSIVIMRPWGTVLAGAWLFVLIILATLAILSSE